LSFDAVDALRADYDATPYAFNSFPQSAPGQLAAIAYLFGLETPEISTARVLEIGCAGGGNLMPFAAAHPGARVVGIDLSPVQIDQGRARAQALCLQNLELVAGDISRMELAELGEFDFVIAHGVYSWVPQHVQNALLAAIRLLLSDRGVAYLSYNVYPGWKSKEVVRDAMLLAGSGGATPADRLRDARRIVDFLQHVVPDEGVLARVIAESNAFSDAYGDSYLLHDELETFNVPCYFAELVQRAGAHGLAYLADARPEQMVAENYGPAVDRYTREHCGTDQVLIGQHLDFVANRLFRETLLVHAERARGFCYQPEHDRPRRLHVAACLPPANEPTRLDYSHQEYRDTDGATLFTNDPGFKVAFDVLTEHWPWTVAHQELVDAVAAALDSVGLTSRGELAAHVDNLVMALILQGRARFRLEPVSAATASQPPRLDETVRRMAELSRGEHGGASTFNRWHETVTLSPLQAHLLPLLDGTRDRETLVARLLEETGSLGLDSDAVDLVDHLEGFLRELKL